MPNPGDPADPANPGDFERQKKVALELLLEAWEAALARGAAPDVLASTAIFCALTDMVDLHGAEAVAQMCESLPARVRRGEFTLAPQGQA